MFFFYVTDQLDIYFKLNVTQHLVFIYQEENYLLYTAEPFENQ
jgi:hypothetical protein